MRRKWGYFFIVLAMIVIVGISHQKGIALDGHAGNYVVFTFDTEEDWNPYTHCYHDSYNYIESGALYQLADGLEARGISAIFFVTPNLAMDMPESVRYLRDSNQAIGVHLHPHNFVEVEYPYCPPYDKTKGEEMNLYSYQEKLDMMKRAKEIVESVAGEVEIYRSGKFSCDNDLDRIASDLGYKVVANRLGTFRMKVGIWNLSKPTSDVLDSDIFVDLERYMEFYEKNSQDFCFKSKKGDIIVFSGHPMRLYDFDDGKVDEDGISLFLDFLDRLLEGSDAEIIGLAKLIEILDG